MSLRLAAPGRGLATAILALMCAFSLPAAAQPRSKAAKADASRAGDKPAAGGTPASDKKPKEKTLSGEPPVAVLRRNQVPALGSPG